MLAERQIHFDQVTAVISPVLKYFDNSKVADSTKQQIAAAADISFSDSILLEKFKMWSEEHDDESFIFHIERFFQNQHNKPLSFMERDLTPQREQVEAAIKEDVRNTQKRIFGERVTQLAAKRNLLRNEDLGVFLEVSTEQARKFRAGENKPQLATLKKIADKFEVTIGYLIGLE